MKKYLKLLIFSLLLFVTSCESKIEKIKKEIEIQYVENDNEKSVTKNFYLPLEVQGYELTWETGSPYLKVDGNRVIINPTTVDTNATISASFVYQEKTYSVHFIITLIGVNKELEYFDITTIKNKINIPTETISDIFLPTLIDGVTITWVSSNEDVISNSGVVTPKDEDVTVELKAYGISIISDWVGEPIIYFVTVLGNDSGSFDFTPIINQIEIPTETDANILLPTLIDDVSITWISSNQSIISNTGTVVRQNENTLVGLIAKLKKGLSEENVLYTVNVLKKDVIIPDPDPNTDIDIVFEGYYASLSGLQGSALKDALKNLIEKTGTAIGKQQNQVMEADNCANGQCYLIYTGMGACGKDKSNREHTWPKSLLGSAPVNDLHNLRTCNISVNSSRGNLPFVEDGRPFTGSQPYGKFNGGWYPGDAHIGDVARIVFYISVRYNLSLNKVGSLELFLEWHKLDPVDDFERARNENIFLQQGNKNPFIDYPELVSFYFSSKPTSFTIPLSLINATLIMNEHYYKLIS